MELKFTTKTINTLNYYDLNNFINNYYNLKHYDFVSDYVCDNSSSYSFTVRKETINNFDLRKLNDFKNLEYVTYITDIILTDLCNNDAIPSGEYLVNVWW